MAVATRDQSTAGPSAQPSSCPVTTANDDATPRRVTGIPTLSGTAIAELTPGTTSYGTPAAASASASSAPRPNT